MKEVKKLVTQISGRRGKECYYILCCAVDIALSYQPVEPQMKLICTSIKDRTGKDYKAVVKSLSRAVDDIWDHGDRQKLCEIYGRTLLEKPTPKDIVCVLAQHLWLSGNSSENI